MGGVFIHSVVLDLDKCKGCTTCMKFCPTEAIRVINGKANIMPERCIDCAQCIRHCPHGAKKAAHDTLDTIKQYKYKIALPAPSLYGQFENMDDVSLILDGLMNIGFDDVYEVALAAEEISTYTNRYLSLQGLTKPVISDACPVVVRLIQSRFPSLRYNVMPIYPPVEVAAIRAKERALAQHPDLKEEEIATVFISPCPAKVSYSSIGPERKGSAITCVIGINDVYFPLLDAMGKPREQSKKQESGAGGVIWACTGGESTALKEDRYLACDGIDNVIAVLDQLENGTITNLDFIELNACPGGCVGGVMTVENPYVAKARMYQLRHRIDFNEERSDEDEFIPDSCIYDLDVQWRPDNRLSNNFAESMRMMSEMQRIREELPGLDCGVCGAPNCNAYAEDIVRGKRKKERCPIQIMREEA